MNPNTDSGVFIIPKKTLKRVAVSVVCFAAIIVFGYEQAIGYLIPGFKEIFLQDWKNANWGNHMALMWVPIVAYIIIATGICLFVQIFKELKSVQERGLVWALTTGLSVGLIGALIFGDIMGLTFGLILGLSSTLIISFLVGMSLE